MTTWTNITDLEPSKPVVTGKMTALRDNPIAITEGAAGAPKVQTAAINDGAVTSAKIATGAVGSDEIATGAVGSSEIATGAVTNSKIGPSAVGTTEIAADAVTASKIASNAVGQSEIASGSVHQSELDTSTNEVSIIGASPDHDNEVFTLGGGEHGFYPRLKYHNAIDSQASYFVQMFHDAGNPALTSSYQTFISLQITEDNPILTTTGIYAQQRYINSSPPFDIGDGAIPLFAFIKVKKSGEIKSIYTADVPPWAYNGPTNITGKVGKNGKKYQYKKRILDYESGEFEVDKIEITQAIKNADMPLIPHPFASGKKDGETIVLLDPPETEKLLLLHESGESINTLLHEDYLRIDNEKLNRCTPNGVCAHRWKWKRTK